MISMKTKRKMMDNFNKYVEENPELEIMQTLEDGDEVAFFDEETGFIMTLFKSGEKISYKIFVESLFIRRKK